MSKKEPSKENVSRRRFLKYAGGAAVVVAAGAAGLYYTTSQPSAPPTTTAATSVTTAGQVIVHTAFLTGPRHGEAMKVMADAYNKANPNTTVVVDIQGNVTLYNNTTLELRAGSGRYDIIEGQPQYIPAYVANGWLNDETPYITNSDPSIGIPDFQTDWPDPVKDMYKYGDKYFAIAADANATISYYRKDVFEKLGLQPARTIDEIFEMLKNKDFHNPPDRYGIGDAWGLYWTSDQFLGMYARMCVDKPYPYLWDPNTYKVTLNDETGLNTLGVMHKLLSYMPPAALTWGEDDVYTAMGSVGNVMYAPFESGGTTLFDPRYSKLYDKIDATVVPAGDSGKPRPSMLGFGLIMPKASKVPNEAWKFVHFVTAKENMSLYVQNGGQPARLSALTDPQLVKLRPHFPALAKSYPVSYVWPLVPEFANILYGPIAEEINAAMAGQKSDQAALDAMAAAITQEFIKSGRIKG